MFTNLLILIFVIYIYFQVYMMFKINKNNLVETFNDEYTKQNITNDIAYKLPFKIEESTIVNDDNKPDIIETFQKKKYSEHRCIYNSIPLLEPFVKYFTNVVYYEVPTKNTSFKIREFLYYRNFYIVNNGEIDIYLIHPKYRENFLESVKVKKSEETKINNNKQINKLITNKKNIGFIKSKEYFHKIRLRKHDILFIPNYWISYIESASDNCSFQLVQYKTILNELCFLYDKYMQ